MFQRIRPFLTATLLFGGFAAACGDGGTSGALDQAAFNQDCSGSDIACLTAGLNAPLATGATLNLAATLTVGGSAGPTVKFRSADPGVLSIDGGQLTAKAPGVSAILATTEDKLVLDFVHLWVQDPTQLVLQRYSTEGSELGVSDGKLQMIAGDSFVLAVEALADTQRLLGIDSAKWSIDGDAVSLLDEGQTGQRRIVARQPGNAELKVSAFKLETALEVEVLL